jgi:small subunit ribosomal protein S16
MLRIRLKRLGRKKQPFYRVIVCNSTTRRQCAPIEELGSYDPIHKYLKLDKVKALDWISKGAQPSETVQGLINNCGDDGAFTPESKAARINRKAELKEKKQAKEAEAKAAAEKAKAEEEAAKAAAEKAKAEAEAKAAAEKAEAEAQAQEAPAETPAE